MGAQLRLFSPDDEAGCYHDSSRYGYFSLLVASPSGGAKKQDSFKLSMMPTVLSMLDHNRDTWLSQAEFIKPNRRVVNLARIGLLFTDLDTYKMPWAAGLSPEKLAGVVLLGCQDEGIPPPSLMVFSGRGLQAKWLLDGTLPREALPRWNACQRHLVDKLAAFGSDAGARDASRVLRLVNTVNSKSGEICRVVHVEPGPDGEPCRYGFEYLAEVLLPVSRWDIEAGQKAYAERVEHAEPRKLKVVQGGKVGAPGNRLGFSGRRLAWDRLEDLRRLVDMRGGVAEGERMKHLFWHLNFLLLSGATNSSLMYHEAAALANELDRGWNGRSEALVTLYSKAKAHEAGEKVEFGGKKYPPLYTPKNDHLINYFRITDDEQRKLKTIISTDMAAERHRKRDEARRRAAGAIERSEYEAGSLSRNKPWEALGMSRASWYRAGKPAAPGETSSCVLPAPRIILSA